MFRYTSIVLVGLLCTGAASASSWAEGMFAELSKDFGSVPRGPTVSHLFHFTNRFKDDVHVSNVRVSCGCTTATALDTDVAPGKTGAILAQMDTNRFSGPKTVTIYVQFDRPQWEEVRLWVSANGRDDVAVTPESLSFGQVKHGAESASTVDISFWGNSDVRILGAQCDSNYVKPVVKAVRRDDGRVSYVVTAKLRSDIPVGKWYTDVWVRTNDPSSPRVRVPLTVDVEGNLTVTPEAVSMGQIKAGNEVQRKILIRGTKPFKITAFKGIDGVLSVRDTTPDRKPVHVVTITLRASTPGELNRTIQVLTDLKDEGEVEFQAQAEIIP